MAGHSKWANIRHRKGAQDAKRGKIFTKLIRELTVAARQGGVDADSNPRLRAAIDKALTNNMKRDTIDKAIARGSGQNEGENYEAIRYEGYGPHGVAIMADCLTDNRQRTVAEVRHTLNKHGGNLATAGAVGYLFTAMGMIEVAFSGDEDALLEILLACDIDRYEALDAGNNKTHYALFCPFATFHETVAALRPNLNIVRYDPVELPDSDVALDREATDAVIGLLDALEDLDDVQHVYSNLA